MLYRSYKNEVTNEVVCFKSRFLQTVKTKKQKQKKVFLYSFNSEKDIYITIVK